MVSVLESANEKRKIQRQPQRNAPLAHGVVRGGRTAAVEPKLLTHFRLHHLGQR